MRLAGFLLFVVGVTVASCFAARAVTPEPAVKGALPTPGERLGAWWDAAGIPFSGGMLLVVMGGVLARRKPKAGSAKTTGSAEEAPGPVAVLAQITEELASLPADAVPANAVGIRDRLEDILERDVPAFLAHRLELIDRMGLGKFAEMISLFASMERNAARAWSALTDEVLDEVPQCLERAKNAGSSARELLERGLGVEKASA